MQAAALRAQLDAPAPQPAAVLAAGQLRLAWLPVDELMARQVPVEQAPEPAVLPQAVAVGPPLWEQASSEQG